MSLNTNPESLKLVEGSAIRDSRVLVAVDWRSTAGWSGKGPIPPLWLTHPLGGSLPCSSALFHCSLGIRGCATSTGNTAYPVNLPSEAVEIHIGSVY